MPRNCLGVTRLSTKILMVCISTTRHAAEDTCRKLVSSAIQCASLSASDGSLSPLASLDVRDCMMRLKSSKSSIISGFTEFSSAPFALRWVRIFSYCPSSCSDASRLLPLSRDTLPGHGLPPQNSMSSISSRPLELMKSPGMSSMGPLGVVALSHRDRLWHATPRSSSSPDGTTYRGTSACGSSSSVMALPSSAENCIDPMLALRKGSSVSMQLSVVPDTGTEKRLASSSRKSMDAVKLSGLALTKDTSTGSSCLAMPIIMPSGNVTVIGIFSVSAGSLNAISRLSYPLLMIMKRRVVRTPSGVGASTTSRVSKARRGCVPSPSTSTLTYATSDWPSR
mmetsp:Transcript_18681/g.46508  ORF Transcript_18681/g.46508 Transcript_18681/m.46508 type:complete len:338 (-) Transcript_18681:3905-4918(-)